MKLIKSVHAIVTNPVLNNQKINDNPQGYFNSAIQSVISVFFIFGLVYFIYHLVLSGYHMISSQGDPKKFEEAQKSLLYAFLGIIIIFSIFAIVKLVGTIFGIEGLGQLKISWPTL
jgi:hypothetical protein